MEQSGDEAQFEAMELVLVTHIVDAITFWAQNVTEDKASEKMDTVLSEKCPTAQRVMGKPSPNKVYGACYSGDRCWYRCKVQKQINDTFHVAYIDYGNEEVVARSDLVELPEDLNSAALARRYQFWGFHLASEPDSSDYFQGKSFLQNLIYGKKLRISMKSECFNGTILVQAFQGNLDIGEEVLKFKFATLNFPGNKSPVSPTMAFQKQTGLGRSRKSQGDCDDTGSLGCMPKLRPVSSNQKVLREQSTCKTLMAPSVPEVMASSVSGADGELVKENQQPNAEMVIQHLRSRVNEQILNEAKLELQRAREEVEEKIKQIYKLEKEKNDLQDHAEHLQQELKETRLELQKASEVHPGKDECVEVNMESTVFERFSQLAEKVDEVKRNRESTRCNTAEDRLSEAISVVINDKIVLPPLSETLEMAWVDYRHALKQLKECQSKGELEELVKCKNQACSLLLAAIDDFLMVAGSLPISDRLNTLKDVSSTMMAVFGSVSLDDVQDQSLETFCEWKTQKQHSLKNIRQTTDKSLCALSNWAANTSKFFRLTETTGTTVTLEAVNAKVEELLKQAESDVSEELNAKFFEQNVENMKIMSTACYIVMQHIQKDEHLLRDLGEMYENNKKFKEAIQWQNSSPRADELLQIKKHIKSLRSQLRWKLVEVGCLEEADDLDLPEILRKKEEIAETRNALFQQIKQEKEQYTKLCELVKGNFPELLLLYPEADISSYLLFEGLLMKSLDRDIFDAEPMRELSGRRPLVCTEFQYQKVVLKGYSVDEESEGMMIKQAAQYHKAQNQHPSSVMPLLGLFFGKSDPLAYIIVPYYSNGSLKALQKLSPLAPSILTEGIKTMNEHMWSYVLNKKSAYTEPFPVCPAPASQIAEEDHGRTSEEEEGCADQSYDRQIDGRSRAYYVAKELLDSEREHVKTLKLLQEDFRSAVKEAVGENGEPVVEEGRMDEILSTLPQAYQLHTNILTQLDSRIQQWEESPKMVDVFLAHREQFGIFVTYIGSYDRSMALLEESCRQSKAFADVVKHFEQQNSEGVQIPVKHQLLQIIVRVLQYRMLLTDYLNNLSPDSKEYEDTQAALVMVSEVADQANDNLKEGENLLRLVHIESSVKGKRSLLQPGRVFVKEGTLMKVSSKSRQPRHLFLMNDIILYTYPQQDGKYRMKNTLPLSGMKVSKPVIDNVLNTIRIEVNDVTITLSASSVGEREDWFHTLSRAIADHAAGLNTFSSSSEAREKLWMSLGEAAPVLVPISHAMMCMNCTSDFSLTLRRHQCNACGKVVCRSCSRNRYPLKYLKDRMAKVCDRCYNELKKRGGNIPIPCGSASPHTPRTSRPLSAVFQSLQPPSLWKNKKSSTSPLAQVSVGAEGSTMSGSLQRRKKSKRKWKKLWFLLKDKVLYTFTAREDKVASESLPLQGFTVKISDQSEGEDTGSVFQLYHKKTLYYTFRADDHNTARRWVNAMEEATVL